MRLRGALIAPVAALAVHQLRYWLAFGSDASHELAAQGHAYLSSEVPWIVLCASAALGTALGAAALGRAPRPVLTRRVWLLAAVGLLAVYTTQELLEGLFASGHPPGLLGVFGDGGVWAIPAAIFVGGVVALALRGARAVLAWLVRRRRVAPRAVDAARPALVFAAPRAPLATAAAGRAPPRSSVPLNLRQTGTTMKRRTIGVALGAALVLPATAGAHVTVHPNVVPQGAETVLNLQVPNEEDKADTTKIAVQLPPGVIDVSPEVPVGWTFSAKTTKLAKPVKNDDGDVIDTQVSQITFTGGRIPPGHFLDFPLLVPVPGEAGQALTFKVVQTYSNGDVVRWIDPSESDEHPAPQLHVGAKDSDTADGGVPHTAAAAAPATTKVVEKKASSGLSVVALIVGALGLVAGGLALTRRKA